MNYLKCFLIAVIFFSNILYAQEEIVLQQGSNGYQGCEDVKLLTNTNGNRKYATYFEGPFIVTAYYKC
jgi:hypothetical protein